MSSYRHLNHHFQPVHFPDRPAWERHAAWLKREMAVSLALAPAPPRPALHPEVFGKWQGDGYTCEKVCFESLPGFYVTGNLFRPTRAAKKYPVILSPHGHWPEGRFQDRDPVGSIIARCITFARMGALLFSQDMVGHNDSCQLTHGDLPTDSQFGMSMMAIQTWNSMRILDFLLKLPGADATRIGVTGESGGGTQTFILCGVDERPTVSAPIVMVSYSMQGGCLCENAPLLRVGATNVDIARLFAPKPMFIGSCTKDWTKNTPTRELPALREIYRRYGAANRLRGHHVNAEHNYNRDMREHVYGFFHKYLFGGKSAKTIPELSVKRPPYRDRLVFWGRVAPRPFTYEQFRKMWRERSAQALQPHLKSPAAARKGLGPLLPHVLGMTPGSLDEFRNKKPKQIRVTRAGDVLVVSPAPTKPDPEMENIRYFDTYNRTPFAVRVHEIIAAVERHEGPVALRGLGNTHLACLCAAAATARVKSVAVDMAHFNPHCDGDWEECAGTPGLRQIGGLAVIFAMIGKRPVRLTRAAAAVKRMKAIYAR